MCLLLSLGAAFLLIAWLTSAVIRLRLWKHVVNNKNYVGRKRKKLSEMSVLVSRCAFRSIELIRKLNRSIEIRNSFGNVIINNNRGASTLCQRYTSAPPRRNDNTAASTNHMPIRLKSSKKGDKQTRNQQEDSDEVYKSLIDSIEYTLNASPFDFFAL